jgi:hypothetical protein
MLPVESLSLYQGLPERCAEVFFLPKPDENKCRDNVAALLLLSAEWWNFKLYK